MLTIAHDTLRSTFAGLGALTVAAILGCSPAANQAAGPQPTMATAGVQVTPSSHPVVAAVVTHEVTDYATWKQAFDEHAGARQRAGIIGTHINRGADSPNLVSVYLGASDVASLRGFLNDDDLGATMARAGVKGPPTVVLMTPVEDMAVKDRALPGAIVSHHVASYETWKKVFDEDAPSRAKSGIVGYAINRGLEDPNTVIVYLQSSTLEEVRGFCASPARKETMTRAGVDGAPRIAFVQGADWGR